MSTKKFTPNWFSLWRFMRDPKSDWKPKLAVVVAILYLIWPIDLIPDIAPFLGWLDDIGVTGLAIGYLLYASGKYLERQNDKAADEVKLIDKP